MVACPVEAFAASPGVGARRLRGVGESATGGEVTFACARVAAPAAAVVIACEAGFDPLLAAATVRAGVTTLTLLVGACECCPNRRALDPTRTCADICQELAGTLGAVAPQVVRRVAAPVAPTTTPSPSLSRREAWRGLLHFGAARAEAALPFTVPDSAIGPRQELARRWWPAGAATPKTIPVAAVTISGDCFGCPPCLLACPTQALRIVRDDRGGGLVFTAERCHGCNACADACGFGAIDVQRVAATGEQVLARLYDVKCAECGEGFFGTGSICPRCFLAARRGTCDTARS